MKQVNRVTPKALVCHCCDNRFVEAHLQHLPELGLQAGEWFPLSDPGGVAAASRALAMVDSVDFRSFRRRLKFILHEATTIRHVIGIIHQDCKGIPWLEKDNCLRRGVDIPLDRHLADLQYLYDFGKLVEQVAGKERLLYIRLSLAVYDQDDLVSFEEKSMEELSPLFLERTARSF